MEEAALLAAFAAANGTREMRISRALQVRIKAVERGEVKRYEIGGCGACAVIRQRGCRDG